MQGDLVSAVDAFCGSDLSVLYQVGLQERAVLAPALAGRLLGCADQALGELDARYQGNVITNLGSEGPALYQAAQGWWRDAAVIPGRQAGDDLRRAAVLRDLPLLGQAVLDGVLTQEQAAVLGRLHGTIGLEDLLASQEHLITVARGQNTEALGRFVSHLIATHCEPALDAE